MKYIDKAIKKIVKPFLINEGFVQKELKYFQRERGELIDKIWFQMSKYGSGAFYVYYSCSLLSSDGRTLLETGDRYDDNNRKYEWIGDNTKNAELSIIDALEVIKDIILPWFDKIKTPSDLLLEECLNNYRNSSVTIIRYCSPDKLKIVNIDEKCFMNEALKYENLKEDTIEKYVSQMIKIASSSIPNEEMSFRLDEIDKQIKRIKNKNREILLMIFNKCKRK
jgi:hypothetical protein